MTHHFKCIYESISQFQLKRETNYYKTILSRIRKPSAQKPAAYNDGLCTKLVEQNPPKKDNQQVLKSMGGALQVAGHSGRVCTPQLPINDHATYNGYHCSCCI